MIATAMPLASLLRARSAAAIAAKPGTRDWLVMVREMAWFIPLAIICGWMGGFLHFGEWAEPGDLARLALIALLAPALGEELLFRVLPIPRQEENRRAIWPIALSVFAFVLWHPLQAAIFGAEKVPVFLDPWFLAVVAALGLALARIYHTTGSIWPCVAMHWLIVVGWKAAFGGPPNPFA